MNKNEKTFDDKQGTVRTVRGGVPLLRSLFIDGQRAHARLRLPIWNQASDRPLPQPVDAPGIDDVPVLAMLTARPPVGGLDNLAPKEGDLVAFTFRLLSAAYLGSGGYHLDFSQEGMLERSLPLFKGPEEEGSARKSPLVVVRDHSFNIEDRIGLVHNARWSPVPQQSSGSPIGLRLEGEAPAEYTIPYPGIDAELHINWKLAGEVVRRLLHEPPLLDACSVSLGFSWEKSHPDLEDQQFWMRLGEELDGSPVRVVVTEILSVEHVGLVFAGADSSARRMGPSDRRQEQAVPESAGNLNGDLSAARIPGQTAMTTCLVSGPANKTSIKGGNPFMEKKNITITSDSPLLGLLGVKEPDLALLEQRAGELKCLAELGREALADLRREVKVLIVQLDGAVESEPSQGLLKVVQAADAATLKALKDEYTRRLDSLIPTCCQVCGSEQVSRRSSREANLTDGNQGDEDPGLYR